MRVMCVCICMGMYVYVCVCTCMHMCAYACACVNLGIQILSLHTEVGVDDVQSHEQAHDDGSLLLQQHSGALVEVTVEGRDTVTRPRVVKC